MALPTPAANWKLVKYLIRVAEEAIPATAAFLASELAGDEEADPLTWMKVVIDFDRGTPAGTVEDKAQIALHLVNITGGAIDSTWTSGDFTTVRSKFDTWWTSARAVTADSHSLSRYRFYRMGFNPGDPGPGARVPGNGLFIATGPPVYQSTTITTPAGSGNVRLPYQMAASVTLRTAFPRHWGRVYHPGPSDAATSAQGRWGSAFRTTLADSYHDMITALADADFLAVVPVGQIDKQPFHGLLGVSDVVVDDIPDVVRRRRPKQVLGRTTGA